MTEQVERAVASDSDHIWGLRRSVERWLVLRGIKQWEAGEVGAPDIQRQIEAGQWYVLRGESGVVGALRLLWSDEPVWREDNAFAAYVHGLMVDRRRSGCGVGEQLLDWAARRGVEAGAGELRLDCAEDNPRLRAYYAGQGFTQVGRRDFDNFWYSVVLLAKPLDRKTSEG